jgi:serine protease AprX
MSDTCSSTSDTDGVLGCKVPDYYANCLDHLDKCRDDNFGGYSGTLAFACDQTCYCSANRAEKYVGARGKNCEEMILDSSGTAPKAKIAVADYTSSDMCSSGSMGFASEDLYSYYFPNFYVIDDQARISSNSWGISSCDGAYDSSGYYVDKYIWENQDFSVFFAAGNDGYSCGSNPSVVSPATSKNGIAVGASETGRWPVNGESATNDPDTLAYFSGIGLTEDGRFKPDIVAPGYYVVSANSSGYQSSASCSVTYMQGTSMSTPIAAGGGALIRQCKY